MDSFGQRQHGNISDEVRQQRLDACRRRDYTEHLQLRALAPHSDSESDSDASSDSDEDDDDEYAAFPITHEFQIKNSDKKVTSLELNKNSSAFAAGAQDSTLQFFNYNQLQLNRCDPYLQLYPFTEEVVISEFGTTKESGNYAVNRIVNDRQTDNFLVIPNFSYFKVIDARGEEVWKSTKGDVYIQDYSLTKGHVNDIKDGFIRGESVVTCSKDATIRTWDVVKATQVSVAFFRDLRRERGAVDHVAECGNDARRIVSGDSRGKIQIFDTKNLNRPQLGYKNESGLVSLHVNEFNANQVVVRTLNDEIKVFDLRNFQSPVLVRPDFYHSNEYQNLQISNNGAYLIGSTAVDSLTHRLEVLELSDLSTKYSLSLKSEPTCLKWAYGTNQILVGDVAGNVTTLFGNGDVSSKGIKLMFNKPAGKRRTEEDDQLYGPGTIYNAEDLHNRAQEQQQKKKQKQKQMHVVQEEEDNDITVFAKKDIEADSKLHEDPREALLKYADKE